MRGNYQDDPRIPDRRTDAFASIQRILDAARRVLNTDQAAATLSRVAKEAGVGVATLYRHFPNRRALALAVYEHALETEIDPLLRGGSDDTRSLMRTVVLHLSDVICANRVLLRDVDNLAEATTRFVMARSALLAPIVARAYDDHVLRRDVTVADLGALVAILATGLGLLDLDDDARRRYLDIMLAGLAYRAAPAVLAAVGTDDEGRQL